MKTYRIGVIGLGQRIAHVLAAMKEVGWNLHVAGQVDPAPVGASILAAAGIAEGRVFETPADLLARGPFDLVMIGTPNHLHFEHIGLALDAGYPVFAEKPIVRTQAESLALASRLAAALYRPRHALHADRARGAGPRGRGRTRRDHLDRRHGAPAARARRLPGAELAAQGRLGR